mgnify:CR=1 FL=1
MRFIDVDDSAKLDIRCKRNRSFDLTINLNKDTTGKTYQLQVDNGLTFSVGNGLTINARSITLSKLPALMDVATGVFAYDLVEIDGGKVNNVFYGNFIIEPSVTSL